MLTWLLPLISISTTSAQQCYTDSPGVFDCTHFVKNNLPSTVDVDAHCPFSDGICRSDTSNIMLDTGYIDSVRDLGINSPQDESIQFRAVLHCAPLKTQGYTIETSTPVENHTQYHYGPFLIGPERQNATEIVENLYTQYYSQAENQQRSQGKSFILR